MASYQTWLEAISSGDIRSAYSPSHSILELVPEEYRKSQLYLAAIQHNAGEIQFVPPEFLTTEQCLAAVMKDYMAFQYLPDTLKTPEVYLAAMEIDGRILKFVPDEHKTEELCRAAVSNKSLALQFVPRQFITPELCDFAIERYGGAIRYVPDEYKTPERCLAAVLMMRERYCHYRDPYKMIKGLLRHLPQSVKILYFYLAAFDYDVRALQFFPKKYQAEARLRIAERHDWDILSIPARERTLDFCLAAVKKRGMNLRYVPKELKTLEVCIAAYTQNAQALRYMNAGMWQRVQELIALFNKNTVDKASN